MVSCASTEDQEESETEKFIPPGFQRRCTARQAAAWRVRAGAGRELGRVGTLTVSASVVEALGGQPRGAD